jgi:transcriptional regulator with GAF, ATPase, and Fis domain
VDESRRRIIMEAIRQAGGNYRAAARQLGLNPGYLHRLMKNLAVKEQLRAGDHDA